MFALKNKYYLYIENTKDLNLNLIKKRHKFSVIYRNTSKQEDLSKIIRFRQECKQRGISFYFANNLKLSVMEAKTKYNRELIQLEEQIIWQIQGGGGSILNEVKSITFRSDATNYS